MCGRPVDEHDRHVRFRLPDPILERASQDRDPRVWKTADDPLEAVMLSSPDIGAFIRAVLPVLLTGGYTVTFGVWVGVHPDDLRRAYDIWWSPDYPEFVVDGLLANAIPPFGLLGSPVHLAVRDEGETPYCVSSHDPSLQRVLDGRWDHDLVLGALPG
jgi:hypothetical protein